MSNISGRLPSHTSPIFHHEGVKLSELSTEIPTSQGGGSVAPAAGGGRRMGGYLIHTAGLAGISYSLFLTLSFYSNPQLAESWLGV